MTPETVKQVKSYYDDRVKSKLEDFVEGNARIERAWETVESWAPSKPGRILEIACAIGGVCWRLSQRWPEAEVIGIDISDKSVEIAKKLFRSSQVSFHAENLEQFRTRTLERIDPSAQFDLIILMDVYEHFDGSEKQFLHKVLRELRSQRGRIILSVPTPRHLEWLRVNDPNEIQPFDNYVNLETISTLAREADTEVVLYKEVSVWHEGDYAHAVLGKQTDWLPVSQNPQSRKTGLLDFLFRKSHRAGSSRAERLRLVQSQLGKEAYPR